jgi:membrane protein DedA with SNARE-associated domain
MMSLQIVVPILHWESTTFSRPSIALICFGTIALFPSVLLPSSPFMWLAGMTFGYLYGFLIITVGMSIGMSLPYFIGSAFHCRIHVSPLLSSSSHVLSKYIKKQISKLLSFENIVLNCSAEMAGEVAKESSFCKACWRGRLAPSI